MAAAENLKHLGASKVIPYEYVMCENQQLTVYTPDFLALSMTFNGLSEGEPGFAVCKSAVPLESRTRESRTSGLI
jgi:hypothetical protein